MKNRIRAEAIKKGLIMADIAKYLDISSVTVSKKMNGHSPWTAPELEALSELFKVSVDYLIKGGDSNADS